MVDIRIKKTSGKTWATSDSQDFITPAFLKEIGELLVDNIVYEAGKDFAKQGNTTTPVGAPEGIPGSVAFFDSFKYRVIAQKGQVEIYSTWPRISQILEGRRPYSMEWLTQQAGVSRVPMQQPDGTVLIRSTPATGGSAWIHPGFKKHTFVRRGYEKARRRMKKMLAKQVAKTLAGMPIA
jgi:hypothetical protein